MSYMNWKRVMPGEMGCSEFTYIILKTKIDYAIYDWVDDDGYNNLGAWIEKAQKQLENIYLKT